MPDLFSANARFATWSRFRYSLRDLLVFMFGLAAGFASVQSGQNDWSSVLLAAFTGWFVIGMGETSWDSIQRWRAAPAEVSRDVWFGRLLEVLWPIGMIGMVVLALEMGQLDRRDLSDGDSGMSNSWVLPGLIQGTLMLAVICGYSSSPSYAREHVGRWEKYNSLFAVFVVCAALFWVSLVVLNQMLMAPLVHVALEGVYSAQPTRWSGKDFEPARLLPDVYRDYVHRGLVIGALSATSFALACGIPVYRRLHWAIRIAMFLAWCGCIASMAVLISWSYTVALPILSPLLAPRILTQPATNYLFGLALILFAANVLAWRIAARPIGISIVQPSDVPVHRRIPVMVFFLMAAIWGSMSLLTATDFISNILGFRRSWSFASMIQRISTIVEVHLSEPRWIIRLAAMALVAQCLWRTWRAKEEYQATSYAVGPIRFAVTAALLTITGVVSVPAMAWYGVALYFWISIS